MARGGRGTPRPHMQGENNAQAVLTWKEVYAIREEYATTKLGYKRLASHYNVSPTAIYHIIRNTKWVDPEYTPPAPR